MYAAFFFIEAQTSAAVKSEWLAGHYHKLYAEFYAQNTKYLLLCNILLLKTV